MAALQKARDVGITFFDTSCVYGYGKSEELIGEAFAQCREDVVIGTKAGFTTWDAAPDFSPGSIRKSLDGSLTRLRSDYVDLLQLHNPPPALLKDQPALYETLESLKEEGLIRAHGISVKGPEEAIEILSEFSFSSVQVNLNMMDIRAFECGLLELAPEKGAGIIARTPLCFGFLSGAVTPDTEFPVGDHRNGWPRAQLERWCEGAAALHDAVPASNGESKPQMAIRFCISPDSVSCVIPGILTPDEAVENAAAGAFGPLTREEVAHVLKVHETMDFFVARS